MTVGALPETMRGFCAFIQLGAWPVLPRNYDFGTALIPFKRTGGLDC